MSRFSQMNKTHWWLHQNKLGPEVKKNVVVLWDAFLWGMKATSSWFIRRFLAYCWLRSKMLQKKCWGLSAPCTITPCIFMWTHTVLSSVTESPQSSMDEVKGKRVRWRPCPSSKGDKLQQKWTHSVGQHMPDVTSRALASMIEDPLWATSTAMKGWDIWQ